MTRFKIYIKDLNLTLEKPSPQKISSLLHRLLLFLGSFYFRLHFPLHR
jgi:hypothetical protein